MARRRPPDGEGPPSSARMVGATSTSRHEPSTIPSRLDPGAGRDERRSRLHDAERPVLAEVATMVAPVVRGGVQDDEVGCRPVVEELGHVIEGVGVRVVVPGRVGDRRSDARLPKWVGSWRATGLPASGRRRRRPNGGGRSPSRRPGDAGTGCDQRPRPPRSGRAPGTTPRGPRWARAPTPAAPPGRALGRRPRRGAVRARSPCAA